MTRFSLQAVFIDSWAKMPENINDTLQQDAFERNTTTLWNLTTHFKPFAFKTLKVTQINRKEICVNVFPFLLINLELNLYTIVIHIQSRISPNLDALTLEHNVKSLQNG